ncbi:hypothetical protein [Roseomonas sp. BN140053]|uniref:hypothetical protein n=1 Tax=Roseomonas sp. BN140053 TaxID=3391898 RepID=UPI0039E9F643
MLDAAGTGRAVNEGTPHAITAANFNVSNRAGAAVIDTFGKAIRMPTRLMMGADEIVRGLAYRMELRRMATEEGLEALRNGTLKSDRDFAEFIERSVTSPGEDAHKLALQVARESTFSQKLDRNGRVLDRLGSRVGDMVTAYPPLRAFLPFITTPTNIIKWFADHSIAAPLASGSFYRDVRGLNGEMAQRMAAGRMSLGAVLWGAAYYLTSTGSVTGNIPGGQQGTAERATGAMPYSVRVVDAQGRASFVPFSRFDPIAMHLGVAADIAQLWDHRDARTVEGLTMGYVVAVAQNLFNKTYLKGISDLFSLVSDPLSSSTNPGERIGRQFANTAASLVPFSGLQRGIARAVDPVQRETRPEGDSEWSMLQRAVNQVKAQTPGMSATLPPVRDLMGNPVQVPVGWGHELMGGLLGSISPLQYRNESQEPFLKELRRLGYDMAQLVPWRNSDGLPMPAQMRDRLILLTTQGAEFNGKTMQEMLNELVQSQPYREQGTDDGRDGAPGSRRNMLRAVVRAYRAMGEELLRQENPEWGDLVQRTRIQRRQQLIPGIIAGRD